MDIISKATSKLVLQFPFYGKMLMAAGMKVTDRVPTMATDGETIFINPKFVENELQSNVDWVMFVLAHEVEHMVLLHCIRRGSRDPMLWNMAADHIINNNLLKVGLRGPLDAQGRFLGLADSKYSDMSKWSSESVYNDLLDNPPPQPDKPNNDDGDDGQSGEGSDEGDGGSEGGDGNDDSGSGGKSLSGKGSGASQTSSGAANIFDGDVLEPSNDDGSPLSDADKAERHRRVRGKIMNVAAQVQKQMGIGAIPAHLQGAIGDLSKPQTKWYEVLRAYMSAKAKSKNDWSRLNRRLRPRGIKMPTKRSQNMGSLGIMLDTSGSCWSYIPKVLAEVIAIAHDTKPVEIRIMFIDTGIQHEVVTTPNTFDADMAAILADYPHGGGTDLRPGFRAFDEDYERTYDAIICMTDMMTPWPDHCELGDKVIFLDTYNGRYCPTPPFGISINLDKGEL